MPEQHPKLRTLADTGMSLSDAQFVALEKQPSSPLLTLSDLWDRCCEIFGPGNVKVLVDSPSYQEIEGNGSKFYLCQVRVTVQVNSEYGKRTSPQEETGQYWFLKQEADPKSWIAAAEQAKERACFAIFRRFGPQFARLSAHPTQEPVSSQPTPASQPGPVSVLEPEPPALVSASRALPRSARQEKASATSVPMTEQDLKREQVKYWGQLNSVLKSTEERTIFLGVHAFPQDSLQWSWEQVQGMDALLEQWHQPPANETVLCHKTWQNLQPPLADLPESAPHRQIRALMMKLNGGAESGPGTAYIKKMREALGLEKLALGKMNLGQITWLWKTIQEDQARLCQEDLNQLAAS